MLDPDEAEELAAGKPPIERFRQSAVGGVFAAGLLGLRDVFEPLPPEEVVIEQEAVGEPFDQPILMRLDPDHPEDSIVMVRPWLLHHDRGDDEPPS